MIKGGYGLYEGIAQSSFLSKYHLNHHPLYFILATDVKYSTLKTGFSLWDWDEMDDLIN